MQLILIAFVFLGVMSNLAVPTVRAFSDSHENLECIMTFEKNPESQKEKSEDSVDELSDVIFINEDLHSFANINLSDLSFPENFLFLGTASGNVLVPPPRTV